MKFRYYATFVSGLQNTVKDIIKSRLNDVIILTLLDGAVIFETACSYDALNFFCFNNIFSVIHIMEKVEKNGAVIEVHMQAVCHNKKIHIADFQVNKSIKTFRIITSYTNKLVSVNENIKRNIEYFIFNETGLMLNRTNPDTEFWFLYRNEGFSIFMKRLSKHASFDKVLHKGELQPQLAYMMCWISNPQKSDVILDPFCGYGSILQQRVTYFTLEKMYSFDIKNNAVNISKNKIKGKLLKYCDIKEVEFFNIAQFLPKGSIDKIITDPPWGIYEKLDTSIQQFYDDMLLIFFTLLKQNGVVVLLTAKKEEFFTSVSKIKGFVILETSNILVSGKKASVFKLQRS